MGFKSALGKAFPFISAALSLGGPFGSMAAAGIGQIIGVKDLEPTTDAVEKAITTASVADPDIILKIKQVEMDFQAKMKQLDIDTVEMLIGADNADRADARAREVAIKDKTPMIIAYAVAALTMTFEGYVLFHGVPSTVDGVIVGRVLGTLDSALIMVLSYYFGSSAGSESKNKIIADQATAASNNSR